MRINWKKIDFITYNLKDMSDESLAEYRKALLEWDRCYLIFNNKRLRYLEKRLAEKCNYRF